MARKPSVPKSPTEALAERVVAWHNRHPLAQRIGLEQVQSVGVVAMPFVRGSATDEPLPGDQAASEIPSGRLAKLRQGLASLRGRWLRPRRPKSSARPPDWQAVFSEDFLEPLRAAEVRPWAARHAVPNRPGDEQWSQRVVLTDMRLLPAGGLPVPEESEAVEPAGDGGDGGDEVGGVTMRYAATAALVLDHGRRRVLISTGKDPSVLGRRSWSVVRISMLTATLASLTTVGATLPLWRGSAHHPPASVATASVAASQAGAEAASHHPAPSASAAAMVAGADVHDAHSHMPTVSEQAGLAASASSSPASSAVSPAEGASVPGHRGMAADASAAPDASHRTSVEPGSSAAADTSTRDHRKDAPPAMAGPSTVPATKPAAPPRGPIFALVSRGTQSEIESRMTLSRMAAAAAPLQERLPGTHTEVMRSGGRWAAVWWPFSSRDDASQARWALALKGVTVDVVEF